MAQPLLHRGQNVGLARGLGIDDAIGMQSGRGERRREQIPAPQAPQDRAVQAGENAGREERRDRGTLARLGDLVHGPQRQPPAQMLVQGGESERQDGMPPPAPTLELRDLRPQLGQNGSAPGT